MRLEGRKGRVKKGSYGKGKGGGEEQRSITCVAARRWNGMWT